METKGLSFNEATGYCKKHSCHLFALNHNKFEIFFIEYDEIDDYINVCYDADDNVCGDAGCETCDCGFEDYYGVEDAIKEHPHILNLVFFPFNNDDYKGYGSNYHYASEQILKCKVEIINENTNV